MSKEWAYDYASEKLMEALWRATARAAISNSGLVIDLTGSGNAARATYLHGVILSRLDGKRPPFMPGDKVRMNPKATYYCSSVNRNEHHSAGEAKSDTEYLVENVFYEKVYRGALQGGDHYRWTISFRDKKLEGYRFDADRFEKVEQEQLATA